MISVLGSNCRLLRGTLVAALAGTACDAPASSVTATRSAPVVSAADVHHFVAAARNIGPTDTSCAALNHYLRAGTPGLNAYRRKFDVGRPELCAALHRDPDRYARLAVMLPRLDSAGDTIRMLFARFQTLSPGAVMPAVYFVVGNGISGGTTTRGSAPVILIGTELMRSTDGVPRMVAHELAHTQQRYPWWATIDAGPRFIRGTLLQQTLKEGTADVVAEVLTGEPKRDSYGETHEAELWAQFQRDMHGRDYREWLYNGRDQGSHSRRPTRPTDLGYWMGYRIAKAYYERSADKARALHEMLTIRDFDAFLAASGYRGGA
jgi:hypothetical protein